MQSPQPDIALQKKRIRQEMLAKRRAIPAASHSPASQALAVHFEDHPILSHKKSFAGYHAIRGELDVLPIFERMQRWEKTTALPCVVGKDAPLLFRKWSPGEPLTRDALGIQTPLQDATEIKPELVLVPVVAFDSFGNRLGYGGGFYDQTIARMRQTEKPPLIIGVAFGRQEVEILPTEAHDATLDGILTETGVSMFGFEYGY